jgi:hypothetical protein
LNLGSPTTRLSNSRRLSPAQPCALSRAFSAACMVASCSGLILPSAITSRRARARGGVPACRRYIVPMISTPRMPTVIRTTTISVKCSGPSIESLHRN